MARSGLLGVAAIVFLLPAPRDAIAEGSAPSRIVEVYWSETQTDLKSDRSATLDNRMSLEASGATRYDLEILWGWRRSNFPQNRRRDISGEFGSDVPISSYSKVNVDETANRYTIVVVNRSYRLIAKINIEGRDCNADVRYVLNPGQEHFEMLSVAGEQHVHFKSIVTHRVKCELGGQPTS